MGWKEPRFSLRKLYHPSGWIGGGRISIDYSCPCGCDPSRQFKAFEQSPEQLGIRDTPGMCAVKKLDREKRIREKVNKPRKITNPWKGARSSVGETTLPIVEETDRDGDPVPCKNSKCEREHKRWVFGDSAGLYHVETYKAHVYTLGSAVAKTRIDRRRIIKP